VNAHELADAPSRRSSCIGCGFHRTHVAAHDGSHETGIHLLPPYEDHVRGFDHRVSRLDHPDEAARFHESKGFARQLFRHALAFYCKRRATCLRHEAPGARHGTLSLM